MTTTGKILENIQWNFKCGWLNAAAALFGIPIQVPLSLKGLSIMTNPSESTIDSIQGEKSVPFQDDPVVPDPAPQPEVPVRPQPVTLHRDIYAMIVDQVAEYGKQHGGSQLEWNKTLLSLACTSKEFQNFAERHIYTRPRFRQWDGTMPRRNLDQIVNRFLFALSARPCRARVVRELHLMYSRDCSDINQLIQTVRTCRNLTHLSLYWSPKTHPNGLQEQTRDVALLLRCSKKVRYFTFWKFDDERPGEVKVVSRECSKFYQGLTGFTAIVPASELAATLSSHHLPNLKYFHLGQCLDQQPYRRHSGRLLLKASKSYPHLHTLDWGVALLNFPSLQEACKVWGPTLRSLRVRINDPVPNPISQLLPLLPHLEELSVRAARQITRSDVEAIVHYARSTPLHLRNISLESRTLPMHTLGLPPIDDVLAELIDALHPTLESLHLEYDHPVKPGFIRHLAKAKKLHHFYVEIEGRAKQEHLDLLSRECPRLKQIYFPSDSSAPSFVPAPYF